MTFVTILTTLVCMVFGTLSLISFQFFVIPVLVYVVITITVYYSYREEYQLQL